MLLHVACYEEREDCLAVVHAHPPHAVALTLSGDELLPCMPEAVTGLGDVPTARYATPGTALVAEAVRPLLRGADCVLMERHGALAMGFGFKALLDACDKMEMLEGVARVQLLASLRRPPTPLPDEERRVLGEQRRANLERIKAPPRPWERDR
jgi:L-fuculose-phosphate aldolase